MSDSLQPPGLQHTRLPSPSLSPGVFSNSSPLKRLYYQTVSSSTALLSFGLQSFPASRSFAMSWLFASGGQSIGTSASVLSMYIQGLFPLGLAGLISLLFKGLSRVFFSTTIQKHQLFGAQPSLWSNSHSYMTTGKTIALTTWNFVSKVMSLLLDRLSWFFIAFLPKSKHLLFLWLQSSSAVILEPNKICHCFYFLLFYLP